MARKGWEQLTEATRKRYTRAAAKAGLTEAQTRTHYQQGGDISAWRGHTKPAGVREREWESLKRQAKRLRWPEEVTDIPAMLEGELAKGFTVGQMKTRLVKRTADTYAYRRGDATPGRVSWMKRNLLAQRGMYWYH